MVMAAMAATAVMTAIVVTTLMAVMVVTTLMAVMEAIAPMAAMTAATMKMKRRRRRSVRARRVWARQTVFWHGSSCRARDGTRRRGS
jgi:hypothetical protein